MAELSEDEKQALDDALSTLDDLCEATLLPHGGLCNEQMDAVAKLAEEAMGCVLSVLDPAMFDAVRHDHRHGEEAADPLHQESNGASSRSAIEQAQGCDFNRRGNRRARRSVECGNET